MSNVDVKNRVAELISEVLDLDAAEQENLRDEEGYSMLVKWTSAKHAEIIVAVEDEYDIEIDDRSIVKLNTLAKIAEYVEQSFK